MVAVLGEGNGQAMSNSEAKMYVLVNVEPLKRGPRFVRLYGSEIKFSVNDHSSPERAHGAIYVLPSPLSVVVEYGGNSHRISFHDIALGVVDYRRVRLEETPAASDQRIEDRPKAPEDVVLALVELMRKDKKLARALEGTQVELDILRLAAELDIENKTTTAEYIREYRDTASNRPREKKGGDA